jgi:acetyltransferase-like isoleucine patch superfamily enzyme
MPATPPRRPSQPWHVTRNDHLACLSCPGRDGGLHKVFRGRQEYVKAIERPTIRDVEIKADVIFGRNVVVHRPSNLYGCEIGDDVMIGPFVEIQCGARVGRGSRIQSHCFICEMVSIGEDCFVSHGVMFVNDTFASGGPARVDRTLWKSTVIGNGVSIGTGATILPVTVCANVVIGAGAVVTRNIDVPGIYAGNPARLLRRLVSVPKG